MEKKTVGIIGAGVSGLLACKYALQKGFCPIVFEANTGIGGVWLRTTRTTRLQTPRRVFRFIDFPWPEEVEEICPESSKVLAYIESYARHFDLHRHICFGSHVVTVDYVGMAEDEMESGALWAGTGEAFGGSRRGRWQLTVQHSGAEEGITKVYDVDFLILCIGRFSGLPNIPSFPQNKGPEVFRGKVLHSMDYSNLDNSFALDLIKGKRTVVVGFSKSAVDIAAECSDVNGASYPCTLIYRSTRWLAPADYHAWGVPITFLYLTRFAELLVHKPREGFIFSILATLLSPLGWFITKLVESHYKWKIPLKKYGLEPNHSITQAWSSTSFITMPDRFYERIGDGSIVPKKSKSLSFYESGVVTDDGQHVPADAVILATGFKGDEKIRNIFASAKLQRTVMGSTAFTVPLYRDCIHPRIPHLAIIGYCESLTNLFTTEMRCIWLMHFLSGGFRLPAIRSMEEDVLQWQEYMKRYCRSRSSNGTLQNWYNDQLCKDIGYDPARKKGLLLRWFVPYLPGDYRELAA